MLPRLRAAGEAALADQLHAEHEAMALHWAGLREPLLQLSERQAAALDGGACAAFAVLYAGHIEREEQLAYPAASAGLAEAALAAMGAEMAQRRQR